MKVEVKEGEGLKRLIQVELPADTVNAEMDNQYREYRKKVTLKGFRRGKAPMNMIKSLYKGEITVEVADILIKRSYPEAVRESKLKVASTPSVSALDFTDEGALTYTADVEILPEIGPVKFDGLEIKEQPTEVSDSDVDGVVEMYRERASELRDVDRPAKETDVVEADLKKLDDPKEIMKDDSFDGVLIDLAKPQTVKEFKEQLPGMKVGDEREIEVIYAEDYADNRFAGASIKYLCKVTGIKERILPEFSDDLAKQSGLAETALEFRLKIRDQLKTEREEVSRNNQKQAIINQLIEKNEFSVPEAMINDYLDAAVQDVQKQYPDAKEEEIRKSYREAGIGQMRWNFLLHELAEQEKIEVLPSDTENWINGFAQSNNITPEQAGQVLARDNRARNLKESLLENKVLDFLLGKARIVKA